MDASWTTWVSHLGVVMLFFVGISVGYKWRGNVERKRRKDGS